MKKNQTHQTPPKNNKGKHKRYFEKSKIHTQSDKNVKATNFL